MQNNAIMILQNNAIMIALLGGILKNGQNMIALLGGISQDNSIAMASHRFFVRGCVLLTGGIGANTLLLTSYSVWLALC